MSAHYAMCKYDDATGSYIPLEVRPITDKLKKDDPLYQEGFRSGAASRDAEIAQLNKEAAEKFSALAKERDQLTEAYEAGKREQADELEAATQQLAAEQAKNVKLLDFIARAQVSSGVCCCGKPMDGHSSPMSCGHSPVDMWDHAVGKLLDAPSDDSALEAYVTKAGEKMRVNCITAAGPEDSYLDDWIRAKADACDAIRALPAVTLEDLK